MQFEAQIDLMSAPHNNVTLAEVNANLICTVKVHIIQLSF